MSRTYKQEYHKPDGWHIGRRFERQARPAGRMARVVEADLLLDVDPPVYDMEEYYKKWEAELEACYQEDWYHFPNSPCGGFCRRCLIHGDPGGCVGA